MLNFYQNVLKNDSHIKIIADESLYNDPVFFNNDNGGRKEQIDNDQDYHDPDFKQWVFHTTALNNLFIQYANNMVLPLRDKLELRNGYYIHKELSIKTPENGIFIVDRYRVCGTYSNTDDFLQSILDYYTVTHNVYGYEQHLRNAIFQKFKAWTKNDYAKMKPFSIRIITFIPEKDLIRSNYVNIPSSNITIGIGPIQPGLVHPSSRVYKENHKLVESNLGNHIEVDIVDPHGGYTYYINIGNEVFPLKASMDPDREPKATINVYNGLDIISHKVSTLEELGSELGIYKTEVEAKYNGDLKLLNDKKRLENELEKIKIEQQTISDKLDIEKRRLEVENSKLEHELEMMKIEKETLLEKYEHENSMWEKEKIKKDEEILFYKNKSNLEIEKMEHEHKLKMEYMYATSRWDLIKQGLSINQSREKHQMEKEKHICEMEYMGAKHQYEKRIAEEKVNTERNKANINALQSMISLGTTIAKIL